MGQLGIIYKSKNSENKELLIISIDLFKYYENNKNKDENIIIKEIKNIINNNKDNNKKLYVYS